MSEIKTFLETAKKGKTLRSLLQFLLVKDITEEFKGANLSSSISKTFEMLNSGSLDNEVENILNETIFKGKKDEVLSRLNSLKEAFLSKGTGTASRTKEFNDKIKPKLSKLRELSQKLRENKDNEAVFSKIKGESEELVTELNEEIEKFTEKFGREGGFRDTPKIKELMDATKKTISEFKELFLTKDVSSDAGYYDSIIQDNISFVLERDIKSFTSDDVENYITAVNNAVGKASTGKFRPLYIDHEENGVQINSSFPKRLYKGKRATLVKPLKFLINSDFGQDWWKQWSKGQTRKGVITASEIRERIVKQLFYGGLTFREHFNFRAGSDTDNEKIIRNNEKLDIIEEKDEAGNKTKRLKLDDTLNKTIGNAVSGESLEKIFSSFYTETLGKNYNPTENHNKLLIELIKKYRQPVEKFQNFLKKEYSDLIDKLIKKVRTDKSKLGTVIRIENVELPKGLEYDEKENTFIDEEEDTLTLEEVREIYEGDELATINQYIKNINTPMEEPDTFFDFLNSKEDIEAYFNKIATNQLISPNVDNLLGVLFELSEMAEREGNYEVLEEEIQSIMTNKAFDSNEKREQIEKIERAIVDKLKNYSRLIKRGFAQKAKDFIENHRNYSTSADVRGKLLRQLEEQNVIRRG
jgi:hypothetical protein